MKNRKWLRLLAYVTGGVNQELLLQIEYLTAENRILRTKLPARLRLSDTERATLAEIGKRLGRKALKEIASIAKPDTILAWYRKLIARKFDGSKKRDYPGRPGISKELEALIVRMARENRGWGYDRIVGALANLGSVVSDQTVGNVLKRHGIAPAPKRSQTVGRTATQESWGHLHGCRYLLHDRDTKFCNSFRSMVRQSGVKPIMLPASSPNLNAFAERWVRSVRQECLSKLVLCSERSLMRVLTEFAAHYHAERNHQGKGNLILFPERLGGHGKIECHERLGGLLKYYARAA